MAEEQVRLSMEDIEVLREFHRFNRHHWKAKLRDCWLRASYPGVRAHVAVELHRLRNASYFGPAGLDKIRLHKEWP